MQWKCQVSYGYWQRYVCSFSFKYSFYVVLQIELGCILIVEVICRLLQFRQDILGDIIAGLSVGVMTVPQSMGYSLLASMPPKYGLYTSLFPVLVYFLFGTSRHVSLGTMALSSLVIRSAIIRDAVESSVLNTTSNSTTELQ